MGPPPLEALSPEIQAQIMCNISSRSTLVSLLRASPRFYQVFRDRREYLLTQLAFNHFHPDIIDDVWALAKALQMPRPIDDNTRIYNFLNELRRGDDNCLQPSMALTVTIPLCNMAGTIAWFVQDYHRSSLRLLGYINRDMDLQHDPKVLHSDISATEVGRLQRAFCRFESFCCLFGGSEFEEQLYIHGNYANRFLLAGLPDEVEEIACIREYVIRRLWGIFEAVEDDALEGLHSDAIREFGKAHQLDHWFSGRCKHRHPQYMEGLMSQGLTSLKKIFESEGLERAQLVISASNERRHFLTHALEYPHKVLPGNDDDIYDDGKFDGEDVFEGDDVGNLSQGLLWANKTKVPKDYYRQPLKGLRDWGYVFWDDRRLRASGVLDL
ncbi:MAG: hypothetical protein Q9226_008117, partial [Calogaya cf. arnoldii]